MSGDDEILMPCDREGCGKESTHNKSVWVSSHQMLVMYYCPEHAPEDAIDFRPRCASDAPPDPSA